MRRFQRLLIAIVSAKLIAACTQNKSGEVKISRTQTQGSKVATENIDLINKGRTAYMAHCIACHSSDPKQSGGLGPDVYGSSRVLIEARVLRGQYPEGYKPKRPTAMMVAIPSLENEIDALHAFLNHKTEQY